MMERVSQTRAATAARKEAAGRQNPKSATSFGSLLNQKMSEAKQSSQAINFSKHAMNRVEERGIQLTPELMEKLTDSVEKAQERGATNILAFDARQAFIINVPYARVVTTMTQDEMKANIFTNIDGAVIL